MDISTSTTKINSEGNETQIYPNPTDGTLYINLGLASDGEIIKLYDYSGQLLQGKYLEKGTRETTIDLSIFPVGAYFLQVNNKGHLFIKI